MSLFFIQAEYTVPTYVRYAVEAASEEEALIVGARVADDVNGDKVWIDPSWDYDASSRITVTIVPEEVQDADDLPRYQVPAKPCDVGGASAAPAIRHLGQDLLREITAILEASESEVADQIDLYAVLTDWRHRLNASL